MVAGVVARCGNRRWERPSLESGALESGALESGALESGTSNLRFIGAHSPHPQSIRYIYSAAMHSPCFNSDSSAIHSTGPSSFRPGSGCGRRRARPSLAAWARAQGMRRRTRREKTSERGKWTALHMQILFNPIGGDQKSSNKKTHPSN